MIDVFMIWVFSKSVTVCMVNIVIVSFLYNFSHFTSTQTKMTPMYILVFPCSIVEFIYFPHTVLDPRANPWQVSLLVDQFSWLVCINNGILIMLYDLPVCIHIIFNGIPV